MDDWMFEDAPNVAVLTTRSIVQDGAWVARVFHDEDGAWQFHHDAPGPASEDEAMVMSLRSMVMRDATLARLADLPEGWNAWRDGPTAPWQRARSG